MSAEHCLVARIEGLTGVSVGGSAVLLPHQVHVRRPLRLHWRVEAVRLVVLLGGLINLCHWVGLLSGLITASVTVLLSRLLLVNSLLILIAAQLFLYICKALEGDWAYLIIDCKTAPPSYINK